jgi:hypothetical protein
MSRYYSDRRHRKVRGQPLGFYHATPFRLTLGTHLRPRWSRFAFAHRIWMSGSLVGARATAKEIMNCYQQGCSGYAGTGFGDKGAAIKQMGQQVFGLWIYRIKPTGPVVRFRHSTEWTSAFPGTIVELAATYGEPQRNTLAPPPPLTAEGIARVSWDDPWEREDLLKELQREPQPWAPLRPMPPEQAVAGHLQVKLAHETAKQLKEVRDEHHKLHPDPRYHRARSKRMLAREC